MKYKDLGVDLTDSELEHNIALAGEKLGEIERRYRARPVREWKSWYTNRRRLSKEEKRILKAELEEAERHIEECRKLGYSYSHREYKRKLKAKKEELKAKKEVVELVIKESREQGLSYKEFKRILDAEEAEKEEAEGLYYQERNRQQVLLDALCDERAHRLRMATIAERKARRWQHFDKWPTDDLIALATRKKKLYGGKRWRLHGGKLTEQEHTIVRGLLRERRKQIDDAIARSPQRRQSNDGPRQLAVTLKE